MNNYFKVQSSTNLMIYITTSVFPHMQMAIFHIENSMLDYRLKPLNLNR